MGIADLWPILPSDERVSFPLFLSRFVKKHSRPPRLAIDAYMFMFWASLPNGGTPDPEKEPQDLRNLMAKLWYLVQNNVSFVVVLDGRYKPDKLRHGHLPDYSGGHSYDDALRYFLKKHTSEYTEGARIIESLKKILSRNKMDWVQAPGEAEAECAWLQRLGVVDYVVTNDSDTMVFGATAVLRWFNRVKEENDNHEPIMSEYYHVTPVHMSHITEQTSLTRNHLVMIAVLRGGDYSHGAEGIGITRAKELALCGTSLLVHLPRKTQQDFGTFPDITAKFVNTFLDFEKIHHISPHPYYGIKSELDRLESLDAFNKFLNEFLHENGKRVFGRATQFKKKVHIDDYYAMLYFFPLVNTRIFKFTPRSTSFGESCHVEQDIFTVNVDCEVSRVNNIIGPAIIGKSIIKGGQHIFVQRQSLCYKETPLPRERKKNLKVFVVKFLREKKYWNLIQFKRIGSALGVPMADLRFDRIKLNEFTYYGRHDMFSEPEPEPEPESDEDEEPNKDVPGETSPVAPKESDKSRVFSVKVSLEMVSYVSQEYVNMFHQQNQASRKTSPKKKLSPQKNTLDKMWPSLSPIRSPNPIFESPTRARKEKFGSPLQSPMKQGSANDDKKLELDKLHVSLQHAINAKDQISPFSGLPTKKKTRGRKTNDLPPGQLTLLKVLEWKQPGTSASSPIKVSSDEEDITITGSFQKMKSSLQSKADLFSPDLLSPKTFSPKTFPQGALDEETFESSLEESPTKRYRRSMQLSANSSPIKVKYDLEESW